MNYLKSTRIKKLLKTPVILGGVVLASLYSNDSVAQTQCGFGGLGCASTDYSNFGLNSNNDPASIEYDNFVSTFHSTVVRDAEGKLKIWGQATAANGTGHLTAVSEINSSFSNTITGTILKAAMGSNSISAQQTILLTTDGLFAWGNRTGVLPSDVTSNTSVQKITVNNKSDGLPAGVSPVDVKMMFATYQTLAIVTCDGAAWVLSQAAAMRGTGSSSSANQWNRVKINSSTDLNNVIAVRGTSTALMALTSDNKVYTWGAQTLSGSGVNFPASMPSQSYATEMTLPAAETGQTIKMIGATNLHNGNARTSYYILYTNGHLWALGNNSVRQLGDWSTTNRSTWVQPRYPNSSGNSAGNPMNDIVWISPNEHDNQNAAVNVINSAGRLWNFGTNAGTMLGRTPTVTSNTSNTTPLNPGQPLASDLFNPLTSTVLAVETGGHTSMITQQCQPNFGYVGHATNGSAGNGANMNYFTYTFSTAAVQICGVTTVADVSYASEPITGGTGKVCANQIVRLTGTPTGGTYSVISGPGTVSGNALTFTNNTGTVVVRYAVEGPCGPVSVDKAIEIENCETYHIRGTVWIDDNADAIKDNNEHGTNTLFSNNPQGLYANLINAAGLVVASVPVQADGSYEVGTTVTGTYSVSVTNGARTVGFAITNYNLPVGWAYTGHNNANDVPCVVPSCQNPHTISGIDLSNGDLNGNDFGVRGIYSVSGTIFHDADGLNGSTETVDGSPVYGSGSEYENQGQPQLYINVLDANGKVIHFVPVANDGTYNVDIPLKENATLQLTTALPIIGETAPSPTLPAEWVYAGESFGIDNGSGTGMNDGTGSGNNGPSTRYDGIIHVSFPGTIDHVSNVDFGMQQPPVADAKVYEAQNNFFKLDTPAGFPTDAEFKYNIPMSSTGLVEKTSSLNGSLSGSDAEDCLSSSCNGNGGAGDVNATFNITAINPNTKLYYDFGGQINVQPVIPGTSTGTIENFDVSKMVIYAENGAGQTGSELGFSYAITDRAGATSDAVTYQIKTVYPLPLVLTDFSGFAKEGASILNWETVKEEDISHFNLMRSSDGKLWAKIAEVKAVNKPDLVNNYTYSDNNPNDGSNFYKLEITDRDGSVNYSKVINIFHKLLNKGISLYPNPATEFINLSIHNIGDKEKVNVVVMDAGGAVKQNTDYIGNNNIVINMNKLSSGIYHIQITRGKEIFTHKVVKR